MKYSNAVQVRDGRGVYEPTESEQRKNALRLCRDAIKQACRDSVIAQQLEQLDGVPVTTLNQEAYKINLLKLLDIASNATRKWESRGELVEAPDYTARLKAHEIIANLQVREAELLIEYQKLGLHEPDASQKPASGHENVLTRDEAVEILQARRRRQAVGA
jgi:hypothetical protein